MLSLPPTVRVFVVVEPIDMRGSFDALAGAVRRLGLDPVDGHLYLFLNRRRNQTTFGIQLSPRGGALPMAPAARSDAPPFPHDW